jgi:hypothetical protein
VRLGHGATWGSFVLRATNTVPMPPWPSLRRRSGPSRATLLSVAAGQSALDFSASSVTALLSSMNQACAYAEFANSHIVFTFTWPFCAGRRFKRYPKVKLLVADTLPAWCGLLGVNCSNCRRFRRVPPAGLDRINLRWTKPLRGSLASRWRPDALAPRAGEAPWRAHLVSIAA